MSHYSHLYYIMLTFRLVSNEREMRVRRVKKQQMGRFPKWLEGSPSGSEDYQNDLNHTL